MALEKATTCQSVKRRFTAFLGFLRESPVVCCGVPAIVAFIFSISWAMHGSLSWAFGFHGALAVDLLLLWRILRFMARAIILPGSLTLMQRNTEALFRAELSSQYWRLLHQLELFLRSAASGRVLERLDGALQGCLAIERLQRNFAAQSSESLTFEQAQMKVLTENVQVWIQSLKLGTRSGSDLTEASVSAWLEEHARWGTPPQAVSLIGTSDFVCLEQLIASLDQLSETRSWWRGVWRFFKTPSIGSLGQLRAELQLRYQGDQCWVSMPGRSLDAMFLPAESVDSPVVVFFNPNAGYYETMAYQTSILDFYRGNGCGVFLFNYGGYGRSSGTPSPATLTEDADAVVAHLRARGHRSLAVHGRSIGGIPACHVARGNPDLVQLLIADRTFSTLGDAAEFSYGRWAAAGLTLAGAAAANTQAFLEARCHKVMVVDPSDHMVPDLAALRTAVASELVQTAEPEPLVQAWAWLTHYLSEHDEPEVRGLLELVGGVDASGALLEDFVADASSLRAFLANLRAWGSRQEPCQELEESPEERESDVRCFLRSGIGSVNSADICCYHRNLAHKQLCGIRTVARRLLAARAGSLNRLLLHHVTQLESFISTLLRGFKSAEGLEPEVNHAVMGFVLHCDCGHNGALDELELRQLRLHLHEAGLAQPQQQF